MGAAARRDAISAEPVSWLMPTKASGPCLADKGMKWSLCCRQGVAGHQLMNERKATVLWFAHLTACNLVRVADNQCVALQMSALHKSRVIKDIRVLDRTAVAFALDAVPTMATWTIALYTQCLLPCAPEPLRPCNPKTFPVVVHFLVRSFSNQHGTCVKRHSYSNEAWLRERLMYQANT